MADQVARVEILANANQATREFTVFGGVVGGTADKVKSAISGITGSVLSLHSRMASLGLLLGGGLLVAGVKGQIDLMDATNDAAEAAGVSVQTYSELGFAAKMSGSDSEALSKALVKISDATVKAAGGDADMRKLFKQLGIDAKDAEGKLRSSDAVLNDLADIFAKLPAGPEKTALAVKMFGERIGPGLVPLLNSGRAGITELREEFRKLHGVMTDDSAQAAAQFNDNMDRINTASQGVRATITNAVMPTLVEFSNFFVQAAKDVGTLEAAFLTFGKGVARITGTDDVGLLRTKLKDLGSEMERVKLLQIGLQNTLDRDPGNQSAARRMAFLTNKLADLARQAATTQAGIAKLEEDAKGPPPPPKPKGSDGSTLGDTFKTKEPEKNRTAEWAALLEEQKKAYADGMAMQGQFSEWGLAEESRFWQMILSRADLSQAEKLGATQRHLTAERGLRKQAAAADLATKQVEIDAAAGQYTEQMRLMENYVASVGQLYGVDSREYQEALRRKLQMTRDHETKLREIANIRREAQMADRLDDIASEQQQAELRRSLGLITQAQLLEIRARAIEQRREIELLAKQAELEAEKGGINDPVAVERIQAEIAAIKRRYKGLTDENKGQQTVEQADPLRSVLGTSQQALQQGFDNIAARWRITAGGIRDTARQIGGSLISELVTKPLAAWIVGGARKVAMSWIFGQQEVAATAAAGAEKLAVEGSVSLSVIAMRAYQAAAGAYAAIAAIPYVGPVLAPIAAGVALAGALAFAKNIFSAEGGFDIPKGMNPIVQTHSNEMILPSKHADTIRMMGDLAMSGQLAGGAGVGSMTFNALDAKSFERMLRGPQGDMLVRALAQRARNRY
ncbi:hypothetical protein [Roseateles sp. P5_E7]